MAVWPYNTGRWRRLRRAHLTGEPLCRYCREVGRITAAVLVDHIEPVEQAPDKAFDPGNLQSLCDSCHSSVKQREEITGHRAGCAADGWPVDPRHHWNEG